MSTNVRPFFEKQLGSGKLLSQYKFGQQHARTKSEGAEVRPLTPARPPRRRLTPIPGEIPTPEQSLPSELKAPKLQGIKEENNQPSPSHSQKPPHKPLPPAPGNSPQHKDDDCDCCCGCWP